MDPDRQGEIPDADARRTDDGKDQGVGSHGELPELVVYRGQEELARVRVERSPITIGRRADNDIVLNDLSISRQHAVSSDVSCSTMARISLSLSIDVSPSLQNNR